MSKNQAEYKARWEHLEMKELGGLLDATCGVYMLYKGDDVVYVGQSQNSIIQRISYHSTDKEFDSIAFMNVPEHLLDYLEAALIIKHKSKYNKSLPLKSEYFGLVKEAYLFDDISAELKEKHFVIKARGVRYYDNKIINESLCHILGDYYE